MPDHDPAAPPPAAVWKTLGGTGSDLLLLHGFGSDRMSWLANIMALLEVARVSAVDLPGHGAAGAQVGDGRIETLAGAVEAAIEAAGLSRLTVLGHSLGGGLALALAARRPDLVAALVLIAPAGLGRGVDPTFLSAFPRAATAEEIEALLQCLVSRPRLINKHLVARVQQALAAEGARDALIRIADGIDQSGPALALAAATVARHGIPRLTVWGEADTINPPDAEALAAFGGEHVLLAEAAHLPHVEAAPRFNADVVGFLRRHGRA